MPCSQDTKEQLSDLIEKSASYLLAIIHWRLEDADQWERLWGHPFKWLSGKFLLNLLSYMTMFLLSNKKNDVLWIFFPICYRVMNSQTMPCQVLLHQKKREQDSLYRIHLYKVCYFLSASLKKDIAFSPTL